MPAEAASKETGILAADAFGPVRIGMTLATVEALLGTKLDLSYPSDDAPDGCGDGSRADGKAPAVSYQFAKRRLTVIGIGQYDRAVVNIRTPDGVGLGASKAFLKRLYGKKMSFEPDLEEAGEIATVDNVKGANGYVFRLSNNRVTSIEAGDTSATSMEGGCT